MRQFLWGALWGALIVYTYTFHGHELVRVKQVLDGWRNYAVSESSGYATGRKK